MIVFGLDCFRYRLNVRPTDGGNVHLIDKAGLADLFAWLVGHVWLI